ncbi:MAG: acetolactate synthase [Eubacteriales bacterium]|nr:acetolactate synthase [Eubacteriales bacterium]
MLIDQISVFLENKSGRLANVTKVLGDNNIDISALSIADTANFGVLRLIVNVPDKAYEILKNEGFTVHRTGVIAVSVDDKPGGLSKVLELLQESEIGVEYMYAFVGKSKDKAMVILRVEDTQKAISLLKGVFL